MGDTRYSGDGGTLTAEEFISHYGVPGMKWGHRKAKTKTPMTTAARKKADHKFEKGARKSGTQKKIWNQAISDFKHAPEFGAINSKWKDKGYGTKFRYGLTTDRKAYKSYNNEMASAFLGHLDSKAKQMKNATGDRQYRAKKVQMSNNRWKVITAPVKAEVKHEDGEESFEVTVVRDRMGFITELNPIEIAHTAHDEEFISHYGVPGMRWGNRKAKLPASKDSQKKTALKTKAKENKVRALTNKELETAIKRMNLEQNYKRLATNELPGVQRFITSALTDIGKREAQAVAAKNISKFVAKSALGGA